MLTVFAQPWLCLSSVLSLADKAFAANTAVRHFQAQTANSSVTSGESRVTGKLLHPVVLIFEGIHMTQNLERKLDLCGVLIVRIMKMVEIHKTFILAGLG